MSCPLALPHMHRTCMVCCIPFFYKDEIIILIIHVMTFQPCDSSISHTYHVLLALPHLHRNVSISLHCFSQPTIQPSNKPIVYPTISRSVPTNIPSISLHRVLASRSSSSASSNPTALISSTPHGIPTDVHQIYQRHAI